MIERPGNVKSLKIPSRLPVLGCGSFKTESNITQVCKRKIAHGMVSNCFFFFKIHLVFLDDLQMWDSFYVILSLLYLQGV